MPKRHIPEISIVNRNLMIWVGNMALLVKHLQQKHDNLCLMSKSHVKGRVVACITSGKVKKEGSLWHPGQQTIQVNILLGPREILSQKVTCSIGDRAMAHQFKVLVTLLGDQILFSTLHK